MAKSKAGPMGTAASIAAVAVIGYLAYRWLASPRTAHAASGAGIGGQGMAGYQSTPYGTTYAPQDQSVLQKISNALGQLLGGKSSSAGGKGGPGVGMSSGAPSSVLRGLSPSAQQAALAIGQASTIANNMPLRELGGASLANYVPSYDYGFSIPNVPYQNFPLSNQPIDFSGLGGSIDTTSFGNDWTIPSVPYQLFPLSSSPIDSGGYSGGLDTTSFFDTGYIDQQPLSNFYF